MPAQPNLPLAAPELLDSMLTRKFGPEVQNYFSGSPLNRLSFLRTDHAFLAAALTHPSTAFVAVDDLAPAARDAANLAYVSHADLSAVIGENPFAKTEAEVIAAYNSKVASPLVLFLGLNDKRHEGFEYKAYKGVPYFAVDITPKGSNEEAAKGVIETLKAKNMIFLQGRSAMTLNASDAAIFAQARALLDWNARNPFCSGCGQPTLSVHAGTKRVCPTSDLAPGAAARGPCATRGVVSNLSFPRTDPTVIMAILSHDGTKVLLGRQKRWPTDFFSTLAGFCEPAESVEEAVRREVWEESGVRVGRVVVHSSQPWPYPANLMIGAIGQAVKGGEEVNLEHDPELEQARWFDFETVRVALKTGTSGLDEAPGEARKEGDLRLPGHTAIANQLLQAVVLGGFLGGETKI
ncbi:hypothetical protein VF21_02333 [Pseudogymnoascus sp. 05NY08]|nr:hypothetical protein VF21_02333 [Pseudogymnoascus sp. 05NY08]